MRPFAVPSGWQECSRESATHVYDDFEDAVLNYDDVGIHADTDRFIPVRRVS